MWPTLVEFQTQFGPAGVHTYGLMILCAFATAFGLVNWRAGQVGIAPERLIPLYLAAAFAGMLGGRLLFAFAVEGLPALVAEPGRLLRPNGFAVYGGVLLGALGVAVAARVMQIDLWKLGDFGAPAAIVGMGIGRLGCLFSGCCHGAPAPVGYAPVGLLPSAFSGGQVWLSGDAPFVTTEFHGGVGRLLGVPLYPTQLWSAVGLLALGFALVAAFPKRRFDGQLFGLAMIFEPMLRISVEAFRADHRGTLFSVPVSPSVAAWLPGMSRAGASLDGAADAARLGVTTSQAIGLAVIAGGIAILVWRSGQGKSEERPQDLAVDPALAE